MTRTKTSTTAAVADLRQRLRGRVLTDADPGYEQARRVWNGCIDRRPAVIARCEATTDVVAAVRVANERGLAVAVRGGGHSLPGFSTCEDGIVIDLSAMRAVEVDPQRRVAVAQGGARWGDYDSITHSFGLASTGGIVSTTGVAGLTLGGGIGWLIRSCGLACDNLLAAEVITADGQLHRAGPSGDDELLWGLRGGGGNFGVVTRFEFRLHPVHTIVGGLMLFPGQRCVEITRFYRDYTATLPEEFTTMLTGLTAPPEDFVPPELHGQPAIAIIGCHRGESTAAEAALAPLRALGPAADLFGPMPYPALQSMFDAELPPGRRYYFRGGFLPALTNGVAAAIEEHLARRPSPFDEVDLHQMGGVAARVEPAVTAFGGDRAAAFTYNVRATWDEPADDEVNQSWAQSFAAALDRFGDAQAYLNFRSEPADEATLTASHGPDRYQRLRQLKHRLDPDNRFHLNHNIHP